MKRILSIVLATVFIVASITYAADIRWRNSKAALDAVAGAQSGDRGIVIGDNSVSQFYSYDGSKWVAAPVASAESWTTARLIAGNSVNGSANVPFANKFIVQGTTDAGLTGAQFLGALSTGLLKNTTSTGILSIATAGTDYAPATTGSGILKGDGAGKFAAAAYGDVVGLWTECTAGFLKYDGSCATPGLEGDGNSSHFVDGSGVWRSLVPADMPNLENFIGWSLTNKDYAATFSGLDITTGGYSAPWPVIADCSSHTAAGRACYEGGTNKLYIGDGAVAQAVGGGTGEETDPVVKAITGIIKSDGSTISAAVAGTDYQAPITDPVTGTGTAYKLPYWLTSSSIGADSGCETDGAGVLTCKTLKAGAFEAIRTDEPMRSEYCEGLKDGDECVVLAAQPMAAGAKYKMSLPAFRGKEDQFLKISANDSDNSTLGWGYPNAIEVSQAAHGFSVGDVLKRSSGQYDKAQANSAANAEVVGIVSKVPDVDNFVLTTHGHVIGLSGLTDATTYYLSSAAAGALTDTQPSIVGEVVKPLFLAMSSTSGFFVNMRGSMIEATKAVLPMTGTTSADNTAQGMTVTLTCGSTMKVGDAVYITAADGNATLADANGTSTYPSIGVMAEACTSGDTGKQVLLSGNLRHDSWNWTPGGQVFLSADGTSENNLTQTAPTSTKGNKIQVIGIALAADYLLVKPSVNFAEVN